MNWLERVGRGLDLLIIPLLLLMLVGPALFVEVWTDKTFVASHGTFILTAGWAFIALVSAARALKGFPVLGSGNGSRTRLWLLLLAGWMVLASFFAYEPSITRFYLVGVCTYLLIAQSLLDWLELGVGRRRWLFAALASALGIQTLFGALQLFKVPLQPLADAVPVFTTAEGLVPPGGAWLHELLFSLSQIATTGQVVGTLGNYNYLAEFLVLTLPVLLGAALSTGRSLVRWGGAAALVATMMVLLSTGGRGALLGLVVGGILSASLVYGRAWLDPRHWWKSRQARVATVIGAVVFVAAVGLVGERFQTKLSAIAGGQDASINSRLINWRVAGALVLERPIFGTGVGGYKLVNMEKLAETYPSGVPEAATVSRFVQAHNEPLQGLVELGLPAGVMLLGVLFGWIRDVRTNDSLGKPLRFGLYWGAGALLVAGSFGFPLHLPLTALAFMLVLVLGVAGRAPLPSPALPSGYRPAYALGAVVVLATVGLLVFQKHAWPNYVAHRYVKLGEHLEKTDRQSPAVPVVLSLAERHMVFKGEVGVPEMKMLLQQGRHEEALHRYEANARRGLGIDALYWKGRALEKLGRNEEALEVLTRVKNFYPESNPYHIMSGRVLRRLRPAEPLPPSR